MVIITKMKSPFTEYSSRVTRPPMKSFRLHEKERMEENKKEKGGGKQEREREKETEQRDIPRQSLRINDEKKQKVNSKQRV